MRVVSFSLIFLTNDVAGEGGGEGGGGAEEEQGVDAEAGEGEAVGGPDFDQLGNADDCDADFLRP